MNYQALAEKVRAIRDDADRQVAKFLDGYLSCAECGREASTCVSQGSCCPRCDHPKVPIQELLRRRREAR